MLIRHQCTEQFGIGQGARLIRTPHGNVLWDLIAYLDQGTVDKVRDERARMVQSGNITTYTDQGL